MLKGIIKRYVSLLLILSMIMGSVPNLAIIAEASVTDGQKMCEDRITVNTSSSSIWTISNDSNGIANILSGNLTSSRSCTSGSRNGYEAEDASITLSLTEDRVALVKFDYTKSAPNGYVKIKVNGVEEADDGQIECSIDGNQTITIEMHIDRSESNTKFTSKIDITNMQVLYTGNHDLTCEPVENATYSVSYDGTTYQITPSSDSLQLKDCDNLNSHAVSILDIDDGYTFFGWIDSNNNVLSKSATADLKIWDDSSIRPFIVSDNEPVFSVGDKSFTDLNLAIIEATEGDDKKIIMEKSGIIRNVNDKDDYIIPSGITLLLPYQKGKNDINRASSKTELHYANTSLLGQKKAYVGADATPYLQLTIDENVNVNVQGTLVIGGVLASGETSGGVSGYTAGTHSNIVMKDNTSIKVSNGILSNCGYIINDAGCTTGGKLVANGDTKIYQPLTIGDFHNGSFTAVSFYNRRNTPFSSFGMTNTEIPIHLSGGADLIAYCYLYVDDSHQVTTAPFFVDKAESSGFLKYEKEKGSVIIDYNPDKVVNNHHIGVADITVNGDADIGSLKMEISYKSIIDISVDTAEITFPLSHFFNITVTNGSSLTFPDKIKSYLMPGASITINEGATLNVNSGSELSVMDGGGIEPYAGWVYPSGKELKNVGLSERGRLIVNGTMNVSSNSTFAGWVENTSSTGIINIAEGAILSKTITDGVIKNDEYLAFNVGNGTNYTSRKLTAYVASLVDGKLSPQTLSAGTYYGTYYGETEELHKETYEYYSEAKKAAAGENYTVTTGNYVNSNGVAEAEIIQGRWETGYKVTLLDINNNPIANVNAEKISPNTVIDLLWSSTSLPRPTPGYYNSAEFVSGTGVLPAETIVIDNMTSGDVKISGGTMPRADFVYKIVEKPRTDTPYVIEYYTMDEEGNYPAIPQTENKVGTTDTDVTLEAGGLEAPNKTGFTIDTEKSVLSGKIEAGDNSLVLKVYYSRNKYSLTTIVDGVETPKEYYYGAALEIPNPTKEGYKFNGWYANEEDQTAVGLPLVMPAENIIRYAKFGLESYTLTFDTDGGTDIAPITLEYGSSIEVPAEPTKVGYTFKGWYSDAACTDGKEATIPTTMPAGNKTYYAKWEINTHNVTFKISLGDVVDESTTTCTYGALITAPSDIAKLGYHIGNLSVDLNTYKMPDEDIIITGTWVPNEFNVEFRPNGATGTPKVQSYAYDDGKSLPNATDLKFSLPHYDFIGWSKDANNTAEYLVEEYTNTSEYALSTGDDIVLYAAWAPHEYSITYDLNGGQLKQGETNPEAYTVSDTKYKLVEPEKTGYTFTGWKNADGEVVDEIDYSKGGNQTFTATWKAISCDVTLNLQYDGKTEKITVTYGGTYSELTNPNRPGYAFGGWFTNNEFTGTAVTHETDVTATEAHDLFAKWTPIDYVVTYKLNGGHLPNDIETTFGVTFDAPYGVMATPIKEGYTFDGWYLDEDCKTLVGETTVVTTTDNHNLYAKWTPKTYIVEFGGNGGVTENNLDKYTQDFTYDTSEALIANAFTKRGYTFAGWLLTKADASTEILADGKVVINLATEGSVSLFATWTANEYTLIYDANSGDSNSVPSSQKWTYDGEDITISDVIPTKEGHTFLGWAESASATEATYVAGNIVESDQWADDATLHAVWKINSYTITYKVDGEATHTDTVVYNETIPAYAEPSKTGHTFAGWTPAVPTNMPAENVVVEATWTANSYRVVFHDNIPNSETTVEQNFTYDVEKTLASNSFDRTGYTFKGWAETVDATEAKYINEASVKNLTPTKDGVVDLYAVWETNQYEVTLELNGGQFDGETPVDNIVLVNFDAAYATILGQYTLVKTGYNFAGWYFDSDLKEAVGDATLAKANPHPLFAKWNAKTPTVTLNVAGGQLGDGVATTFEATYDKAYGELPEPTRAGYEFDGWFLNDVEVTKNSIVNTEAAHELVAKWTANTDTEYTVEYFYMDLNGNYSDTPNDTKTKTGTTDTTVTINEDNAEKVTGFTFDATVDGELSGNINGDGSLVLKVYYSRNTYTYTTVVDGVSTSNTYKYEEEVAAIADPQKTGYTFNGWYADDKYDGEALELVTKMPASDITIYAKLDINQYTLKFDVNGGTTIADIKQDFETAVTVPADPTKTGYIFAGWYDGEEADSNKINVATTMPAEDITYYAKWTAIKYNVVFDANTGNGSTAAIVHTYDADDNAIASGVNFIKSGYTFTGWNTLADGSGYAYDAGKTNAGNLSSTNNTTVTLYAQWKANEYDVIFNGNGSTSGSMDNQDFTYDVEQALSANKFEKTGYSFMGWAEATDGAVIYGDKAAVKNLTPIPEGAKTLYAVWEPNQYEVTFNAKGGSDVASKKATYDRTYSDVLTGVVTTRDGYTFRGWYLTEDYSGDAVTVETVVETASNHTLYAKWTANSYTVKFDANGGVGTTMANQTFVYDVEQALAKGTYTRQGYVFLGWSEDPEATAATYNDKAGVKNLATSGEVTLYAIWAEGQDTGYKVRHYLQNIENDGYTLDSTQELKGVTNHQTNAQAMQQTGFTAKQFEQKAIAADGTTIVNIYYTRNVNTVTWKWGLTGTEDITIDLKYGATVTVPEAFKTPVQEGYTFKEWNAIPNTMPDEDVTITGQWTINKHDINWYIDGAVVKTDSDIAYNTDITKYVPAAKTGYIFSGWYTDDELTSGNEVNEFGTMPDNNVSYYAKWTPIKYNVKFDINTGIGTLDPVTHTYDANNNVVASADGISKTGYTFKEWNTLANGEGQGYEAEATVENLSSTNGETVTLYAIWTPNTYKVEFVGNGSTSGEMPKQDFTYDKADNLTTNIFEKTGYTFMGWSTTAGGEVEYTDGKSVINLTAEDDKTVKLYAVWKANDNTTYTVKHHLQNVDGEGYTVRDTDTKVMTGTTDTKTQVAANTYEGFTADTITQVNIDPDGKAVVNVYYTRNTYELTWNYTGDETKSETVNVKYGAEILLPSQPTKTGYTFAGWDGLVDKMPANNITLTSTWTINSYTVKWHLTDKTGATTLKTDTYEYDSDVVTYVPADVTGYTFAGWHTDAELETNATVPSKMPADDLEYYGKYEANKYIIKFDLNGGEATIDDQVFTFDKSAKLTSSVPTRTGYIFKNWMYNGKPYVPEQDIYNLVVSGEVTFEAQWAPITYKVSFNGNGATGGEMSVQNFTYDQEQQLTANEYVKDGYTFKGWSTTDDKTVEYTDSKAVENLTDVNNQTIELFAVWEANTYSVKFHGNGATEGSMADQEFVYNVDENLVTNEFVKNGYHFKGWATSENSTDVAYTDKTKLNVATGANGVVDLYAVWEVNTYTVEFVPGNGEGEAATQVFTNGQAQELTANGFNKTGYHFKEWAGSNGQSYADKESVTFENLENNAAITLTAVWEANNDTEYTVIYKLPKLEGGYTEDTVVYNDGTSDEEIEALVKPYTGFTSPEAQKVVVKADGSAVVTYEYTRNSYEVTWDVDGTKTTSEFLYEQKIEAPTTPTKEGHTFKNWTNAEDEALTAETTMPAGDVTYIANWTVNKYDVTWKVDGQTYESDKISYNSAVVAPAENPTKVGYTFVGWCSDEHLANVVTYFGNMPANDVTYYGKWAPNTDTAYKVEHYQNGVYSSDKPVLVETDNLTGTTGEKVTPAVKDYEGFAAPATQEKEILADGSLVVKYYYDRETYAVVWKINNGFESQTDERIYGQTILQIANPQKTGYTFDGWFDNAGFEGTKITNFGTMPAHDVTYYGKWTAITYGISYTMNGGNFGNIEEPTNFNIETETFTLPNPIREGYTFLGWTGSNGDTPQLDVQIEKGTTDNKAYIANFQANTYYVVFDGNESTSGEMQNQSLVYNSNTVKLSANAYAKEGHTFVGWNTMSDGSGTSYADSAEVRNLIPEGSITLYAMWEANDYTIRFNGNGGNLAVETITGSYGSDIERPEDPTRKGYVFAGWEPKLPNKIPARNLTLVAQWNPIQYVVKFDANGGTGTMDPVTYLYDESQALPKNEFQMEGHRFVGWELEDGTVLTDKHSIMNLTNVDGTEIVLTAKWVINQYTISFDTNGGEIISPIVQDYNTAVTTPNIPKYEGYRFDYWMDEEGNETTIPSVMGAKNRTFTAKWTSYLDLLVNIPISDFENAVTDKASNDNLDVARAYYMKMNEEQINKYKTETQYKEHYEALFAVIKAVSERDIKKAVHDAEGPTNNALIDATYGQVAELRLNDGQHADAIILVPDCPAMTMLGLEFLIELFGHAEVNGIIINDSTQCKDATFDQFNVMLAIAFETLGKNAGFEKISDYREELSKNRDIYVSALDGYTIKATLLATTPEGIEYTMDYYIDFFNEKHDVVWMMDADTEYTSVPTAFENEITLPAEPTKTGYTFLGWNTKADGSGTDFVEGTKMGKKAVTYYAQWQVNQYTITFDSNGGSDVDSITADYNADIRNQHPDDPVREGYTFTGWEVTIPDNMPAGDMTIKALWSINSHDLTFDANGGEFAGGEDSVTTSTEYDAVITLPVEPTRTGHTFLGWFDERGNEFIPGTTMPDKAVTYTAKWDVNEYTIKFYSEGVEIDSITADYNADIRNEKPADPTREGYTFAGWDVSIPDNMPAGDMTITATWTINSYNLAFDTNGGVFADGKEAHTDRTNYNVIINNHEEPTRTGYTFIGWFENKEMTGEAVTFPVTMPAANKTYYAGWTANQYEVKLNPAGGSFEEATTSVTVTYDKQFNLPSPKRTGYTFVGWYYGDTKINNTDLVKITSDITVVAKWDIGESFDITYDLNGGAWADGTQVVDRFNVETPTFELETPVREGYTFLGWTGSNGDTPKTKVTITKGTAKDLEYKANWKINEYTITFNTLGADNIDPITQNFGTDIVAPADPTREGYTFLRWDKEIPETMPAGDMTITAIWQVNQYKFTFVTNGGSVVPNITADYNADVTVPADPTREGYRFVGWYDNEKLEGRPVEIPTTMPASDKTFYAKWTINQYKITFNTDGGSKIDEITLNYGEAIDLDVVTTKTGYTFKGWDKTVPQTMPAADIELTAIWQVNQYKFTFVTNGGSVVPNITADYNADVTVPADPTREGYTFVGWYDNEKLEGRPVEIPTTMPASDKTFYAKWTINEYKITFDTAGGSAMEELTFNYGEEIVIDGEPTREGYTFTGWDKEVPNKMPANDIKLTAKWSINTYKVFYEVDGEVKYTDYVAYGNPLSPRVNETKTGYTFSGWSEIPGTMPAHDVTITGSFTANNYKVNFDANYPAAQQVASQTVTFASPYGDLPEVTRTGYTLAGWYLDGVKVTKNTTVKTAGEHTLIAEWTPNTYKVNLDANGGSVAEEFIEVVYDQTFQGLPTPVLEGYDFVGWFNGEEQITSDTKVQITETITLKARWNAAGDTPYKVEHYQQTLDGKYKLVETEDFTGATEAKVQATQKTYTGFKANLDDSMVEGTVKADGSLVLKMYYDRESYTVVWKVRGTELRETYLYGQTIEVPDTTWADDIHTSHVFTGWDVQIPETVTGNATYTAIYDAKYEASIGDTTYRTLKLALANAKSGETVYLEKDITLTEDITVPTGVSLLIPCMDDDTGYQLVENGRYKFNHDNPTTSSNPVLYRTLTVPEGITLTVNGNVLINSVSGRNSGGTAEMDVTGGYAQINLDGNIIVNGGGSLDCFGFVKGQGSITAEKNATVGDLYVVRHWRGGSQALEMYQSIYEYGDPNNPDERQVYPMNEYDCHNIETDIIIKHGASYEGLVKMNANAGQGTAYYHTRFPQVDVNNGIIRLTNENGYVVRSYDEASKEETYTIYGGADFAESSLVILGQKVSTKDFLFPIDGDINFVLNAGDYHFKNDYKFLPGGGVTVNNGATLTVDYGTYVAFYDEFHDVKNTGSASNNYTRYPEREATVLYVKEGGKFINAGTFGGSIVTESPDILIGDYPTWGIETLEANGYTNGTVTIPHELKITREGFSWRYGDISLGEVPNSIIWFGANYDALLAAYKTVPDDLDIYSDETAGPLKEVLAEIKWDLGKDKQDKVDEWTKRVTEGVANLKLRVVQVTFNAAGGTVDEPTRGVTYGTAYGELPIPEYYGFKFLGWYDEDNMAVTAESVMKLKVNTLVLTAKWEKLPADYTKVTEAIAAIPDDMTGYTAESVMAVYEARDAVDMTLGLADQNKVDAMAQAILDAIDALERVEISVSFDANGGEAITSKLTLRYGDTYPYDELPTPVRDGFEFIGWYTAREGGSQITATSKVASETDVILYAKWQKEAVTEPADYTAVEEAMAKIPANLKPYTAASVNKLQAAVDAVIPGLMIDRQGDVDAWAKAIEEAIDGLTYKTITVYLDKGNGECDTRTINVTYGTAITELPSANMAYCDFLGWFTAKEGGEKVEPADLTYKTDNLTIYAQYKLRDADYSRIEEIKAMIPTDLDGYSDESVTRLNNALAQIEPGYTADKQSLVNRWADELYDAYTKLAYKTVILTFDVQHVDAKVSPKNLEVQYKGTIQILPTPTLTHYTFMGWFTEPDGGVEVKVGDEITSTSDFSIYARWAQLDADYSRVEAAIAKIPADVEKYYTAESVAKLQAALDAVEYGLHQGYQEQINKWAGNIEVARQQLVGKNVTVRFDSQGGSSVMARAIPYGKNYTFPANPTREGYTFEGWYTDITYTTKVTTADKVQTIERHTLYARWIGGPADYTVVEKAIANIPSDMTNGHYTEESVKRVQDAVNAVEYGLKIEEQGKINAWAIEIQEAIDALEKKGCTGDYISPNCPSKHFGDVDQHMWYHADVDYVVEKGIMNGTSATTFEPSEETTRGMIVTMLYRMSGEKVTKQELAAMKFNDVYQNDYYYEAVAWAASKGVVNGTSATTFDPMDNITREQMVAMLFRYANYLDYDTDERAELGGFVDAIKVSGYAVDAVKWANAEGLLNGFMNSDGTYEIRPEGFTTRDQAAAFIHRFCVKFVETDDK